MYDKTQSGVRTLWIAYLLQAHQTELNFKKKSAPIVHAHAYYYCVCSTLLSSVYIAAQEYKGEHTHGMQFSTYRMWYAATASYYLDRQ
jgi:hypothetical protein